jgi:hypothetical protein
VECVFSKQVGAVLQELDFRFPKIRAGPARTLPFFVAIRKENLVDTLPQSALIVDAAGNADMIQI